MLQATPALLADCLPRWLATGPLAGVSVPAVLIDARIEGTAHGGGLAGELLLPGVPLSPEDRERLDRVLAPFALQREDAPGDLPTMEQFLIRHWQTGSAGPGAAAGFKHSQQEPMEAICARQSHVLVSLPTGEGKSVLFQVPALCRGLHNRRLTPVLSPLKALMRDQVEGLRDRGFAGSADYLSGDLTQHEKDAVLQGWSRPRRSAWGRTWRTCLIHSRSKASPCAIASWRLR